MYAVVLATSDATVTLGIGGCQTDFSVTKGANKLKIQLCAGQMRVKMMRNNQQVIYQSPTDFQYSSTTDKCMSSIRQLTCSVNQPSDNLNFYASAARKSPIMRAEERITKRFSRIDPVFDINGRIVQQLCNLNLNLNISNFRGTKLYKHVVVGSGMLSRGNNKQPPCAQRHFHVKQ